MTIKTLMTELETLASGALTDYEIFSGTKQYYESLNKTVPENIIVIEPPTKWPINERGYCERLVDVTVYLGRKVQINDVSSSLNSDEYIFDTLITDVAAFIVSFDDSTKVQVLENPEAELFDPDKGESVNNYAYLKTTLKLKISG